MDDDAKKRVKDAAGAIVDLLDGMDKEAAMVSLVHAVGVAVRQCYGANWPEGVDEFDRALRDYTDELARTLGHMPMGAQRPQ